MLASGADAPQMGVRAGFFWSWGILLVAVLSSLILQEIEQRVRIDVL